MKISSNNYNRGEINEFLKSTGWKLEGAETQTYGAEFRDRIISSMADEAARLGGDSGELRECLEILSKDEYDIPLYAERAKFEGKDAWIIIIDRRGPVLKGGLQHLRVYVWGIRDRKVLYSAGG
ncbi:MAG: hypothetical protein QMD66_00960 [Actinomycetota bacterium]|nr:hypothetical protein [Actinomycetota bacterium]